MGWREQARRFVHAETKMKNEVFPTSVFSALGYESAHFGQGQWNGVAIISR
ncbi:hypothetical protein EMGBS4_07730, partial [Acidimicrobiaceae bacterium]